MQTSPSRQMKGGSEQRKAVSKEGRVGWSWWSHSSQPGLGTCLLRNLPALPTGAQLPLRSRKTLNVPTPLGPRLLAGLLTGEPASFYLGQLHLCPPAVRFVVNNATSKVTNHSLMSTSRKPKGKSDKEDYDMLPCAKRVSHHSQV